MYKPIILKKILQRLQTFYTECSQSIRSTKEISVVKKLANGKS